MSKFSYYKKVFYKYRLDYVSIFLIMFLYYGWLQWNNYIGDPDGFYHAKMAEFLKNGQWLKSLPWMHFSTLKENFTDHHLLYHILLVPFSFIKNPLVGVKIATVVFSASMITVFYWLLNKLKINYPFIISLVFITLGTLNFRLALIKTNGLSLLLIWLLLYALFQNKHWLLVLLGFLFVWLYGGWPLALIIGLAYFFCDLIYYKYYPINLRGFWQKIVKILSRKNKSKIWLVFSLSIGLVLGLLINPYWPQNLAFYYQQIIQIGLINFGHQFEVGGEWYGTNITKIILGAPHLFILALAIFCLLFFNWRKLSKKTALAFVLSFGFLLLTVKSQRYVEYFLPFLLLFVACGLTDLRSVFSKKKIKKYWQSLNTYLKFYWLLSLFILSVIIMTTILHYSLDTKINQRFSLTKFGPATQWLKTNTPPQTIILHSDWDEWPMLFYHNDQNYYIIGLDPTFMHNFDPKLHQLYVDITTGKIKNKLSHQIKENFNSNFVLVEKLGHEEFIRNLNQDFYAQLVYQDDQVNIYKLK